MHLQQSANYSIIFGISQTNKTLQSPSSENAKAWIMGLEDNHRDWLLLGRRGSGALELLAGLWRQNRDRSERTSFECDDLHSPISKKLNVFFVLL